MKKLVEVIGMTIDQSVDFFICKRGLILIALYHHLIQLVFLCAIGPHPHIPCSWHLDLTFSPEAGNQVWYDFSKPQPTGLGPRVKHPGNAARRKVTENLQPPLYCNCGCK
jgi:hypothetical protein